MTVAENQEELGSLSEIYDVLRQDARTIVHDLQGGVRMWREAAGANLAAAGFLLIVALTTYERLGGLELNEGGIILAAQLVLAAVLIGFAIVGLRRWSQLRRKYAGLFDRAEKLG